MSTSFLLILRMCNHVPWGGTVDGIIKMPFACLHFLVFVSRLRARHRPKFDMLQCNLLSVHESIALPATPFPPNSMLQEMECLRWCNKCSMPRKRFDHNIEFGGGGVWGRRMRRRSKNSFPTFGAVVGPQARDKDKEVQACERHFNYSIYGTSPRYMVTHPKNQQEAR